jgi:hypothetical protein
VETPKLYLWSQDHDWRGIIVAVAYTEDRARELMKSQPNYDATVEINRFEIEPDLVIVNLGDS